MHYSLYASPPLVLSHGLSYILHGLLIKGSKFTLLLSDCSRSLQSDSVASLLLASRDVMEERSGGRTIDTYIARNSLLTSTALDSTRFSNHQKMVLSCNGLIQGKALILVIHLVS